MAKFLEAYPIKVKAPPREPGTILRRTDFNYLDGHGTFYQFNENYLPDSLFNAKRGDHLSVVLRNLHTDQLDEVVFELQGYSETGKNYTWIRGFIDDSEDCFAIKIEYRHDNPLDSYILVYASARPYYARP